MRIVLLFVAFFASLSASATTVDFEDVTAIFGYTEIESNGYKFSADCCFEVPNDGSNFLSTALTTPLLMEESAGLAFSLSSLDINSYASTLLVTGHLAGGGTVQANLNVSLGWNTFNFDSSWQNLQSISFETGGAPTGLDNIAVSAVPVPAAVWLFGSALAGLGWIKRKQAT